MINSTKHFKASELTVSATAKRLGINNEPTDPMIIANLNWLIELLEAIRVKFNSPIIVSSGYRCYELNRKVGGARNSQHLLGLAADLKCKNNKLLFDLIKTLFDFDLLIDECDCSWVHVSFKLNNEGNRHLVLKL